MAKRRYRETKLPGNNGKWFLELVGAEEPPPSPTTTLAELSGVEPTTVEIVDGSATLGGHGGIILGHDAGTQTLAESSGSMAPQVRSDDTSEIAPAPAPASASPIDEMLDDWQPEEMSRTLRSRRRVRWTVVGLALIVGSAAAFAVFWLPRTAENSAADISGEYREAMVDLRNELPDSQIALATVTDPDSSKDEVAMVVPATAQLEARSNTVVRLASDPLPSTLPFLPNNPMDELESTRENMSFLGASGEQIATRMGRGYVYRVTAPLLLGTPELPTQAADSQTINSLAVELATTLAESVDLVASLPSDPVFTSAQEAAIAHIERFGMWTIDYLATLRLGDDAQTTTLLGELTQMQTDIDIRFAQALLVLRAEVDDQVIELAAAIEAVIGAMPF